MKQDSLTTIKENDYFSKENLVKVRKESSNDSILEVHCIHQKANVVKFTNLFIKERVDSNLIVSMSKIKCSQIDFYGTFKMRNTSYKVKNWNFEYNQLIKLRDDERSCPKVLTGSDKMMSGSLFVDSIQQSTISTEALRFLNSKVIGHYPCDIDYNYKQIDSLHALRRL